MRIRRTVEPVPHRPYRSPQQIGDRDMKVNFKMLMGFNYDLSIVLCKTNPPNE